MTTYNLPVDYEKLDSKERRDVRLQYVKEQNGNCHYCKSPLDGNPPEEVLRKPITWNVFPKGFRKYPVHLHHDHGTNLTIGAVHAHCNAVLWLYFGE